MLQCEMLSQKNKNNKKPQKHKQSHAVSKLGLSLLLYSNSLIPEMVNITTLGSQRGGPQGQVCTQGFREENNKLRQMQLDTKPVIQNLSICEASGLEKCAVL